MGLDLNMSYNVYISRCLIILIFGREKHLDQAFLYRIYSKTKLIDMKSENGNA